MFNSSVRDRLQQKQFELLEDIKHSSEDDAIQKIHKYLEITTHMEPIICPEINDGEFSRMLLKQFT